MALADGPILAAAQGDCIMRRFVLMAAIMFVLAPAVAHAQFAQRSPQFNPYNRPALSPYLDVVRGGNPAINYYLGTLPEIDRRYMAAQQQFMQTQIGQLQGQTTTGDQEDFIPVLPQTGHAAAFQVYGGYFQFQGQPRSYYP